jgi:predicted nucleotidyltransferase
MLDAHRIARFVARSEKERQARANARSARLSEALPGLVALLVARGAQRVWLFGSLAWGKPHEDSDIDLAVEGLQAHALWTIQGELLAAAPCAVDLVPIEEAPTALASRIRAEGRLIHG